MASIRARIDNEDQIAPGARRRRRRRKLSANVYAIVNARGNIAHCYSVLVISQTRTLKQLKAGLGGQFRLWATPRSPLRGRRIHQWTSTGRQPLRIAIEDHDELASRLCPESSACGVTPGGKCLQVSNATSHQLSFSSVVTSAGL